MVRIALIDHEVELFATLSEGQPGEKLSVERFSDVCEAVKRIRTDAYDLIVLRSHPPTLDCVSISGHLRAEVGTIPILVVINRRKIKEKIAALNAGADTWIGKPFSSAELSAQIHALLRRPLRSECAALQVGDLVLSQAQHKGTISGIELDLAPKEFSLLSYLMSHHGRLVSTEDLLASVWSENSSATPLMVRVCMRRLRSKLDVAGQRSRIQNIHGMGYKLTTP